MDYEPPFTVTSETTREEWADMVGLAPDMTPLRRARLIRIGERVDDLIAAGSYDQQDKQTVRDLVRTAIGLIDIELVLTMAELDANIDRMKLQHAEIERLRWHPGDDRKYGPGIVHPIPPVGKKR